MTTELVTHAIYNPESMFVGSTKYLYIFNNEQSSNPLIVSKYTYIYIEIILFIFEIVKIFIILNMYHIYLFLNSTDCTKISPRMPLLQCLPPGPIPPPRPFHVR